MKNFKQFMLLVMTVTMVSLTSCSKNDDGGGDGSTGEGTITAKAAGQQFTTLNIASMANTSTGGGQTTLIIQGSTSSQSINIVIFGYDGVGTYEFNDDNVFISASYTEVNVSNPANSQIWSAPYADSGAVGQVQVSEDADGRIKGTFNFTGKNNNDDSTKAISEGSFNLSKTEN